MCLHGMVVKPGVEVRTVKDQFFRRAAAGARCDELKSNKLTTVAAEHREDGVTLPRFTPLEASDFHCYPATLSACRVMDLKDKAVDLLEDTAEEHDYQLNHVHVPPPAAGREVVYQDRLFVVVDCWDFSKKISLPFVRKPSHPSLSKNALTRSGTCLL